MWKETFLKNLAALYAFSNILIPSVNKANVVHINTFLAPRSFNILHTSSTDAPDEKQRQLDAWQVIMRGHAVANGIPVIAVNRVGHEPDPSGQTNGILFWGSSFVAGPQGEFLAIATTDKDENLVVNVDVERSEQVRRWWPFLRDRRIDAYEGILKRFCDK